MERVKKLFETINFVENVWGHGIVRSVNQNLTLFGTEHFYLFIELFWDALTELFHCQFCLVLLASLLVECVGING